MRTVQFFHPSYLYFLFLLIIPVIVHFFQLRKFKKQDFTNVAFLKSVQIQARKSSTIKKWLILLTRLLALAALIIAFAQPFIPQSEKALQPQETVIYLDNSYSMQMPGKQGSLLKGAVQQLLEKVPADQELSLFTNDETYQNTTLAAIKNNLLQLDYTAKNMNLKTARFKAAQLFSKEKVTQHNFVAISDFQQFNYNEAFPEDRSFETYAVQLKPQRMGNISIDSLAVNRDNTGSYEITVKVSSATDGHNKQVAVSAFNGEQLLAKNSAVFEEEKTAQLTFNFEEKQIDKGRIALTDEGLAFDNTLYFNIQPPAKIKVVTISQADDQFLAKIFKDKETFRYLNFKAGQVDYNQLENADFIVLNELTDFPAGMQGLVQKHLQDGGTIGIIPAQDINRTAYNSLFSQINGSVLRSKQKRKLKITDINYDHPLFKGVFNGRVDNFQYPEVELFYPFATQNNVALGMSNNRGFLVGSRGVYVFSSPLNQENSNFKRSPLIVPVFYNMARQSLKAPDPYFTLGKRATFDVNVNLAEDEVLHLQNDSGDFIPQQEKFNSKVRITLKEIPKKAGNYTLMNKGNTLQYLSFNENRDENNLNYAQLSSNGGLNQKANIAQLFKDLKNENEITALWKWFVIFAAFSLLLEILLLKFLK